MENEQYLLLELKRTIEAVIKYKKLDYSTFCSIYTQSEKERRCYKKNALTSVIHLKEAHPNMRDLYKYRFAMIEEIISLLESEKIPYAILKGAYLGDIAYGDLNKRTSNDIDFLITKEYIKAVKSICHKAQFMAGKSDRKNEKIITYNRNQELAFLLNTHQISTMVKVDRNSELGYYDTVIDFNFKVTWGEYKGKEISTEEFLENVERVTDSNGYIYKVLKPNYFFIQLCLHAYKEANGLFFIYNNNGLMLRAFVDIYFYICEKNKCLNIDNIMEIVNKYEIQSYIYFILYMIRKLFGGNDWLNSMIKRLLSSNCDTEIVNFFGFDKEKTWQNIGVLQRFIPEIVEPFLKKTLSTEEIDKIMSIREDFY